MNTLIVRRMRAGALAVLLMVGAGDAAMAQDAGAASRVSITKPKAQRRAERKAERKAARAKRTEEIRELEGAGYRPGQNDPNYPANAQDAAKKAGVEGVPGQSAP